MNGYNEDELQKKTGATPNEDGCPCSHDCCNIPTVEDGNEEDFDDRFSLCHKCGAYCNCNN